MDELKVRFDFRTGEARSYELPPFSVLVNCNIKRALNYAQGSNHRKYITAQIIRGQPFNRVKR